MHHNRAKTSQMHVSDEMCRPTLLAAVNVINTSRQAIWFAHQQGKKYRFLLQISVGARILEQVGPAAGPKIVWQGLKLFGLTIIRVENEGGVLGVGVAQPARRLGERCKLPQQGPGRSPGRQRVFPYFCARRHNYMLSAHMLSQFRPSVRHTGDSCKNG